MIRQKSSQFLGPKMRSELKQPSALQQEPERDLTSVNASVMRMVTGMRTDSGTAASVEADEDPAANLFPVRAGQSGPLMNVCKKGSPAGCPPLLCLLTFKTFPGCLGEEAGVCNSTVKCS